jgi:hypothetical protein
MRIFKDVFGNRIRFTDERIAHIRDGHPEMANQFERIKETLLRPDKVVRSKSDDNVSLFYRYYKTTNVGSKFMCVVVKLIKDHNFILTAYYCEKIKKGDLLWQIGKQ